MSSRPSSSSVLHETSDSYMRSTSETSFKSPEPVKLGKHKRKPNPPLQSSKLGKRKHKPSDEEEDQVEAKRHLKAKSSKRPRSHRKEEKGALTPRDQCLNFARWIPRGIDMFCILKDVFRIAPLIEDVRAQSGDDSDVDDAHLTLLANISKDTQDQMLQTYKKIIAGAPYLQELMKGDRKKSNELQKILDDMQYLIGQVRSEDAAHLKRSITRYATFDGKGLQPSVFPESKESRAKMGLNHPQIALLLCPIKFLSEYQKDPSATKAKLEAGTINMDARAWPALLYKAGAAGVAGEAFDLTNVQDGLFEGFLLERVMKHVLTGPSSALAGDDFHVSNSCNAVIHGMMTVEAENIAYAAVQARSAITSRDKWTAEDGKFSYRKFYYRIIDVIHNPPDKGWATAILQHYNLKLFKDKAGRAAALSTYPTSDAGDLDEDEDNVALMRKQYALRSANPTNTVRPAPPPPALSSSIGSEVLPPRLRTHQDPSPAVSPFPQRLHTHNDPSPATSPSPPALSSPAAAPPAPKPHPKPRPMPVRKPQVQDLFSPAAAPLVSNSHPVDTAPSEASTPLPRKKQKLAQQESPLTESEAEEVETPVRKLPRKTQSKAKTAKSTSTPKKWKGKK
ncbi:hypothetical protein DEU56DRAFT_962418 [Suillus clintonianus]|uniref:uncharacterized protein n=1 Tax=Suillus clintonianus TaxID=1904413 RepID=UPI001B86AED9|nr:uncharacterized protein DEU56DRAFT_962418 [Suillus clintonianus]KAG2150879.1 hypothetical protein DEU56DRAFT_962418 [Suillus clintonianus]